MRISDWSSDACSSDLRDPHRMAGRKPKLARRFLLQSRSREGRRRVASQRLGLDRVDGEMRGLHIGLGGTRVTLCPDRQPLDLVAAPARKASLERRARHFEQPGDRPILMRSEEHTSELQSLMRISYAVLCLNKKT